MRGLIGIVAILLIAVPVFAQDEGGGGGLPSSLFGGADFGGGNRGQQANPMEAVKRFFAQSKITISGDQEKAIKPIVETAFKQVQDKVEQFNAQQQPPAGAPPDAGQRRGGGRGFGGRGGTNPQLAAELQKINDEVLPKIVATLKPDQQATFKKWQNDEIKKGGGFAALKIMMEEAGAPLSTEQEPQVRSLYVEDGQQRALLVRQGQGTPDPTKVAELEKATLSKVVKLLTAEQRKALLDSRTKQ